MTTRGLRWARSTLSIGQRWRRKRDGVVLVIAQLHRKDGTAEAFYEAAFAELDCPPRFQVTFTDLRRGYELLCEPWRRAA